MPKQFVPAEWDSQAQLWMANSEQRAPFSATWPTSGMTRNGRLLPPEASEPPTSGGGSSSSLLPTPTTRDYKGGSSTVPDGNGGRRPVNLDDTTRARGDGGASDLATVACLLPTPGASDGTGGGQHPDKRKGHSRQLIDYVLAPERWGKYAPAIKRWEELTRPAPAPTEPNTRGNPRLSPAFSEWMMGWAEGWVTDFINNTGKRTTPEGYISRADALKQVGNGVCTRQAVAALRDLLSRGAA